MEGRAVVLGPDGVDALREQVIDLTGTIDGFRALLIGLALTNCAVFAIVLGLWQKLHPPERLGQLEQVEVLPLESETEEGCTVLLMPDRVVCRFEEGRWMRLTPL